MRHMPFKWCRQEKENKRNKDQIQVLLKSRLKFKTITCKVAESQKLIMSLISVLLLLSKCTSELSSYVMPLSLDFDTSLQSLLCSQETLRSSPELWPEQSEYMSSLFTSYIPAVGLSFQLVKKAGLLN